MYLSDNMKILFKVINIYNIKKLYFYNYLIYDE